ncbi:cytochrome P450 [Gloeopeniophorella convolvens]|nr:cytochrome P450 [Gloeopeniophorella convolvens]
MSKLAVVIASVLVLLSLLLSRFFSIRRRGSFIRTLQGPLSSLSWLAGHEGDIFFQNEVGDREFRWMRQYGSAWRIRGCYGVDHLMLADPKALQYILHTSGYRFPKRPEVIRFVELLMGKGLLWAHGDAHRRQRRMMNSAFSSTQLKAFAGLFHDTASKLVQKWKDEDVASHSTDEPVVNVFSWLSRLTLDIVGEAAFDARFGSLEDPDAPMMKRLRNLAVDFSLNPSVLALAFRALWRYIPEYPLKLIRYLPMREFRRFKLYHYLRKLSRRMRRNSMIHSDGTDVMSVLLRASASEGSNGKITKEEVNSQIATLLLAGHDTISSSLTWYLWEMAKHTVAQARIRKEIASARKGRGDQDQLSIGDLNAMTYFQATLKESMRLHPAVWIIAREAGHDDVIPLALPITMKSGEEISSIPIKKGTPIDIMIDVYNRLPSIWGDDADEWRPERFLDAENQTRTSLGVYGNLMNFSGGLRGCIGWRFAVIEVQVVAYTLLENFEFSLPSEGEKQRIQRKPSLFMVPMREGANEVGMDLVVKPVI